MVNELTLTKLSVDQALLRAKSHIKRNEIEEAQELYQSVLKEKIGEAKKLYQATLLASKKDIQMQQGLASLDNHKQDNVI